MTISMNLLIVLSVSRISSLMLIVQVQRDFAGDALGFHALSLLFFVLSLSGNTSILQPAG